MDILTIDKVFKIYKTGDIEAVALRGASLAVPSGSSMAILGPSGAGKSTLLHLIGGLMTPSAGKIIVGGEEISRMDEAGRAEFRRKNIGIVYQADNLIPFLSARENVELPIRLAGGKNASSRARELLAVLGLGKRFDHRGAFLSGGERQRVAIAIALANRPCLILADELTGELDSRTADSVMDTLTRLCQAMGNSLVLVTHNPQVAARADAQVRLVDGEFVVMEKKILEAANV